MTLDILNDIGYDIEPNEFESLFLEIILYSSSISSKDIDIINRYIDAKKASKKVSKEYVNKLQEIWSRYHYLIDIDKDTSTSDFANLKSIDVNDFINDKDKIDWDSVFNQLIIIQPIYYDEYDRFFYYSFSENYWKQIDDIYVMIIIKKITKRCNIEGNKNKFLNMLKIKARLQKPKEPPIKYVLFNNCIINIETKEKIKPTKEYFFCQKIPYDITNTDINTTNIDLFFNSLTGNDSKKIIQLKELIAYCLIRDQRLNKMFFLVGNGSNGKSTFINFVSRMLGADNCVSISSEDINGKNSHGLVNCINKLWIEWNEPSRYDLSATSKFKQLVGGDNININPKNKKTINTKIYGKLVSPTNSLPQSSDKTDGFYRRLVHIMFNQKFSVSQSPPEISDEEISSFWCELLDIAYNIYNNKKLKYMQDIKEIKEIHEKLSNPVYNYIDSILEYAPGYNIPFWSFFEDFNDWASRCGKGSESIKSVKEMLAQININYSSFDKKQFYSNSYRYTKVWRWIPNYRFKNPQKQKEIWKHIKSAITPDDNIDLDIIINKTQKYYGYNTNINDTVVIYNNLYKILKISLKKPKPIDNLIEDIQYNYLTIFNSNIDYDTVLDYINKKKQEGLIYDIKNKITFV